MLINLDLYTLVLKLFKIYYLQPIRKFEFNQTNYNQMLFDIKQHE